MRAHRDLARRSARPLTFAALFALAFSAAVLPGCGLQGEGERCSRLNGETGGDCEDGLFCRSQSELDTDSDICCRLDGNNTEPACIPGTLGGGDGGGGSGTGGMTTTGGGGSGGGMTGGGGAGGSGGMTGGGGAGGMTGGAGGMTGGGGSGGA